MNKNAKNPNKKIEKNGKKFWGSPMWFMLHFLACLVTTHNNKYYKELIELLTFILPCEVCQHNLKIKLDKNPIDPYLIDNANAFLYSYYLHDEVNQENNKQSPLYDDIKDFYFNGVKKGPSFYGSIIWFNIHVLGCTLRFDKGQYFKEFLIALSYLLPGDSGLNLKNILTSYPPNIYFLNNHDAFFYTYFAHDEINKLLGKSSVNYGEIKTFYFSNLSQECNDCKI